QDVAGNHSTAAGGLTLHFDDVNFVVLVTGDTNWYARVASVTPTVGVTLSSAPASGISSIVLKVSGKADVPCTGSSTTYSCALPSAYAPAGQEAPLALSVVATAYSTYSTSGNGSRNFDDVAPTISTAAAVPYPAAVAGPQSWGRDGAHYLRGDTGTLYTFTA